MVVIGIDPGTINTGFGIIRFQNNQLFRISSGVIKPPATKEMAPRLESIYDNLDRLIKTYSPDQFAIETAFYDKNVQSAMKIGYARGVSLLAAAHNKLYCNEYSPREVKKAVVGNGAASKEQVQFMINKLLCLKNARIKFDESDALAVAICHAFKINTKTGNAGSWKKFVEENPDRIVG